MALVTTLAPDAGLGELPAYKSIIVIEEASGAPLANLARAAFPTTDVLSFALGRGFLHVHGTRQELLASAGLTVEKILERL